jgi:glucose-6-phosphate-specific signal transduction histidine kinase
MGTHLFGMLLIVLSVIAGIVLAVTVGWQIGVIAGAIGVGIAATIIVVNMGKMVKDPSRMIPKSWRQ